MSKRQRERRAKRIRHLPKARAAMGAGVALGVALAAPAASQALNPTIVVNSKADTDTATTLRNAINQANANAGADTITFSGVTGTIQLQSPLPTITDELTITGPGADQLTIDGTSVSDHGMLNAEVPYPGTPLSVTVSGLTFSSGSNQSSGGGAISAFNTDLTVNHADFTGNTGQDAGAIRLNPGTLTVHDSTFTGNQSGTHGGAISVFSAGLTLTDSTLTGNSGADGGAVYMEYGPLQISRTTISGNTASGAGGGAAIAYPVGGSISSSTISGNHAGANGGGLFFNSIGYYDVYRAELTNSTVSGNSAGGQGGGVFSVGGMYAGAAYLPTVEQLNVRSSTIAGNAANGSGGGIQATGNSYGYASQLQNSVIGCNSTEAPNGADLSRSSDQDPLDAAFSLIQNAPTDSFTQTIAGSNVIGQNPQLAALADTGGTTETRLPAAGSPLIDKGSADVAFDQRGKDRQVDQPTVANATISGADNSDIGAVELQDAEAPGTAAPCDSHVGPQPAKPAPPQPQPVVVQGPTDGTVGVKGIKATRNGVTFTVTCTVGACNGRGVLTVVERLNGKKITRLLKIRKKRVRVGSKSYSLTAGQSKKITIKLNGTGRKLHRRFKKMPVRLVVSQKQTTGNKVVKSAKLKIRARKKR